MLLNTFALRPQRVVQDKRASPLKHYRSNRPVASTSRVGKRLVCLHCNLSFAVASKCAFSGSLHRCVELRRGWIFNHKTGVRLLPVDNMQANETTPQT